MSTVRGEIGRVVEVHGSYVRIEIDPQHRSPVRASMDGTSTPVGVNSYLTLGLGGGETLLALITDLFAREVHDPSGGPLSLELVKPRRTANLQLLGTLRSTPSGPSFDPGITVLPTLDTPARPATREELGAVLECAPLREPPGHPDDTPVPADAAVDMGSSPYLRSGRVLASYNDLFSRPLAVVGSTGSGKSCTIAHLVQGATRQPSPQLQSPRFIVLDINGEYTEALGGDWGAQERQPNRLYINGREATLPIWLFNAHEACQWLSAAEQAQQPALVNLWALAKGARSSADESHSDLRNALASVSLITGILGDEGGRKKGIACKTTWSAVLSHAPWVREDDDLSEACEAIERVLEPATERGWALDRSLGADEREFLQAADAVRLALELRLGDVYTRVEQTADKPEFFPLSTLDNPAKIEAAAELSPGDRSMRQFLQGLRLRIQNRRNDRRWYSFYNYEELKIHSIREWYAQLGIGLEEAGRVCVIDCSMLAHNVLPYVCGVVGRLVLELREFSLPGQRYVEPWVLVLEEAHNYVKPRAADEARGLTVSRETYERVAKEGRKFGLSLIVASQRPRDVSDTILSQCANFVIHRLQNPDDIEHFRRIVPSQSRRLMEQITVLAPGEAVVVGSAVQVPARVAIHKPNPLPASTSAYPYKAWREGEPRFGMDAALEAWGLPRPEPDPEDVEASPP